MPTNGEITRLPSSLISLSLYNGEKKLTIHDLSPNLKQLSLDHNTTLQQSLYSANAINPQLHGLHVLHNYTQSCSSIPSSLRKLFHLCLLYLTLSYISPGKNHRYGLSGIPSSFEVLAIKSDTYVHPPPLPPSLTSLELGYALTHHLSLPANFTQLSLTSIYIYPLSLSNSGYYISPDFRDPLPSLPLLLLIYLSCTNNTCNYPLTASQNTSRQSVRFSSSPPSHLGSPSRFR